MIIFRKLNLLTVLGLLFLNGCGMPPFDPQAVKDRFPESAPPISNFITVGERSFHYVSYGDPQKPLVVFIHGSPGSWEAYGHLMSDPDLFEKAHIISVDRPGYGKSDKGAWETSLKVQADLIAKMIEKEGKGKKAFVIGHSYGGPVMAKLAMDHPDKVSKMMMLAASVDPELEMLKWFNYAADTWLASALLPSLWKVSNKEILPLKSELELMEPLWSQITSPIIVVQGTEDTLVPEGNAYFIKEKAVNADVRLVILQGENHFLPWNQVALIKQEILSTL